MDAFTGCDEANKWHHNEATMMTYNGSIEIRRGGCKSNQGECGGVAQEDVSKNIHGGTGIQNEEEIGVDHAGAVLEDLDNMNIGKETFGGTGMQTQKDASVRNHDGIPIQHYGEAFNKKRKESASETNVQYEQQGCVLAALSFSCCGGNKETLARLDASGMISVPNSFLGSFRVEAISLPLCIKVSSTSSADKYTHCGILQQRAPEGKVVLPGWVMRHLAIVDGDMVRLEPTTLPVATKVLLESLSPVMHVFKRRRDMLYIVNRSYEFLTLNDLICVKYGEHYFDLVVRDLKPEKAVFLMDQRVVQFAPTWKPITNACPPVIKATMPCCYGKQHQSHSAPSMVTPSLPLRLTPQQVYFPCDPSDMIEVTDWGAAFIPQPESSRSSTEPQQESDFNARQRVNRRSTAGGGVKQRMINQTVQMNIRPQQDLPSSSNKESPSMSETLGESLSMSIHY